MAVIRCETQQEFDEALRVGKGAIIELVGNGEFYIYGSSQVTASGSSQVRAYDSSQVTAYDSSQVTAYDSSQVTASGSSQVRAYGSSQVTAYDSSQVRASGSSQVRAYDSSQVRAYDSSQVTASGSSQVTAYDSSQVTAYKFVAVTMHGKRIKVVGGVQIVIPNIATANEWCEFYGVEVKRGVVTLYKAVRKNFESAHGMSYAPGQKPSAPDWDGGKAECGGGLHFSPRPYMAQGFDNEATRFIACGVNLSEIVVHCPARYPDKIKAPRALWCKEVDIDGNLIEQQAVPAGVIA